MPAGFEDICLVPECCLEGRSVRELLLLVGDADQGCKQEAVDRVLMMGLEDHYADIERALRDNDNADLRNGAMEILVKFGSESLPRLLTMLKDSDEEIRNFSAVMLGDIGNRKAVVPLIHALRDPDANVRHGAAEALGRIGDRAALAPLLELLKEDFWLQYPAIVAISIMKDKRAAPHLLDLLEDGMLAVPVIDALGEIGDPRMLYPLGSILNFTGNTLAGPAARAMVKIYKQLDDECRYKNSLETAGQAVTLDAIISLKGMERLKELLRGDGDEEGKKAAVTLLGWMKDLSVLPDFFDLLADDGYMVAVESSILAIGKEAVPYLVDALHHPCPNVRTVAVRLLCWLGEREDRDKVLPLLSDGDEKVKLEVLVTVREEVPDGMLPLLFEMVEWGSEALSSSATEVLSLVPFARLGDFPGGLVSSADPVRRRRGARLLSQGGDGVPSALLIGLMKDADPAVRREAIRGAGLRRIGEAFPALLEMLNDADAGIREEAVMALSAFGDSAPLHDILRLLGSGGESLDCAVVRSIGRTGSAAGGEALHEYLERGGIARKVEYLLVETLGKIGHKPAIPLISARYLSHPDQDFRRLAIQVMENIAGNDALELFIAAAGHDPHWNVRIAALQTVGRTGGEEVIPVLINALADPDGMVRKNAMFILGDKKSFKAIPHLVKQLADPEIGRHACDALLKFGHKGLPWLHRIMKGNLQVDIRERVIDLIGKIGGRKSIEPLLELLCDPNDAIRLAVIDSLAFCIDTVPLKRLYHAKRNDPSEEVRSKAASALKSITMEKFF